MVRVQYRYRKTYRFSKMGSVGMGMVVDFGTPWHTAYPYCSITGMLQVNYTNFLGMYAVGMNGD